MAPTPADRPDVTVIVVVHNDAQRLPRAVASASGQTLARLEVLIVDDASTDDTQQVAERLVREAAGRVRYLRLAENTGAAGGPRNVGIDNAAGRYVIFLDSDDELDRDGCRVLLEAAEASGADITAGRCVRVEVAAGGRIDPWFEWLYRRRVTYRDIDEAPDLLFDTNSTNKLYPVEFLRRTGLRFPEGRFYEDLEFITKAYVLAHGITVIPERVYLWYIYRDLAPRLSVTQNRRDLKNATDRLAVHRDLDAFLAEHASPAIRLHKDVKFLKIDLKLYVQDLPDRDQADAARIMDLLADYVEGIQPPAYDRVDPMLRVAAYLVARRDLAGVLTVADYLFGGGRVSARLHVEADRVYWGADHLDTAAGRAALDVTALGLHRTSFARLELYNEVERLCVEGTRLLLAGVARNQLDRVPADADVDVEIVARPDGPGRAVSVPAQVVGRPDGDVAWTAAIELGRFGRASGLLTRSWSLRCELRVGGRRNVSRLTVRDRTLAGLVLPVHPRGGRLAADHLETRISAAGDLALQFVPLGPAARVIESGQRRLRASTTVTHARRAAGKARRAAGRARRCVTRRRRT